jgi:2-hydroxymuconate-semialdehyde hydrolase
MTSSAKSPEVGQSCHTGGFVTNYHDIGDGEAVLLIHGSGPGVSAWANWRGIIPELGRTYRAIAPDVVGFGYTEVPPDYVFSVESGVEQLLALMDHLGLKKAHLIGNSFGGALALHFTRRHPDRVDRLVLMGAVSLPFELTDGLDKVWGYTPSRDAMRVLMGVFAHDRKLITDDLVELRYQASMQRGMDKIYETLFPAPRQRWVDLLAQTEETLRAITHKTLLIHGRDDQVIPVSSSIRAEALMPNADLLVFGNCGHWTQIEKRAEFLKAVLGFFDDRAGTGS